MELYILKSTACLLLFFAFYKVVLENSSIHHFKRFYLLGSLLASFLIPLITFTSYIEASSIVPVFTDGNPQVVSSETEATINFWPIVLWTVYALGILFFSVKFFSNLLGLIERIKKNPKYRDSSFINVLLDETVVPHTFFSFIFSNKEQFETGKIPTEVMLHEQAHASQRHSLDVILVEVLQIAFWFNPLFYFLKRSIKLNHEFLADQAVLNAGAETSDYQKILLAFSSSAVTPSLAHSLNYSSIKKRFKIMKTYTSRRSILFRSLLILPLLSILIYGFSSTETIKKNKVSTLISTNDTIEDIQIKIDENFKISLNSKSVAISNLKDELNKLNTNLSEEEKHKYLFANIEVENENFRDFAEEVGNILYTSDIRSWGVTNLKGERDAGFKYIPQINPKAGKTIEEAEVLYQEDLKKNEKYKHGMQNVKKDENNPWSVQVGEPFERDETTGKIIQQKATKAEVAEYNKLAKKYNVADIEKLIIKKKDVERLEAIYKKMTDEQKENAESFPESIPPAPPTPPVPPTSSSLNSPPIPPSPPKQDNE